MEMGIMNSLLKVISAATLGCLIGLLSGCASSSLVDIWHDPSFRAPPLGKILVIAVRKDATKRRVWEDAFAGALTQHGVAAIPSYSLFPDAPPDTDQVTWAAQKNGFDGFLAILRLPSEKIAKFIKGYTTLEQDRHYAFYWQSYFLEMEKPGLTDSQTVALRTIYISTTGDGHRLIWSATSRTPDPGAVPDIQRDIADLVIAELAQRSIINSKKQKRRQ
jgi:hypothetical protein